MTREELRFSWVSDVFNPETAVLHIRANAEDIVVGAPVDQRPNDGYIIDSLGAGRRFVFLGKAAIYSTGVTFMSFFVRANRYLARGTRLTIHEPLQAPGLRIPSYFGTRHLRSGNPPLLDWNRGA